MTITEQIAAEHMSLCHADGSPCPDGCDAAPDPTALAAYYGEPADPMPHPGPACARCGDAAPLATPAQERAGAETLCTDCQRDAQMERTRGAAGPR